MFGFDSDDAELLQTIGSGLNRASAAWSRQVTDEEISCDIYHQAADSHEHNCVGCNLADAAQDITDYLQAAPSIGQHATKVELARISVLQLHLYLELVNSLWERMRDVFRTIGVPNSMWDEHDQKYAAFKQARSWTNFLKHPGFFGYGLHHPIYVAEGTSSAVAALEARDKQPKPLRWTLIDSELVKRHWKRPDGSDAKKKLNGSVTACVLLPDPGDLGERLANEYEGFVAQICRNPDYVEILRSYSTDASVPCFWDDC
ncbi:MAG: hypothetical protein AAGC53_03655 [Actinomycetota bacterium]